MAVATLGLHELLRPWQSAGLQMLYMDDDMLAAHQANIASCAKTAANTQKEPQHTSSPQADFSPPPKATSARQQSQTPPPRPAQKSQPQASAVPKSTIRTESPLVQPSPLAPEKWPEAWQSMWAKATAPCPIIWTYWSLGNDLGGNANPERGKLLRAIIGQLSLPKGSSTFWPVTVPDSEGTLQKDAKIFTAGVQRIRPRYLICFGSKALKTFAPNSGLGPYMFTQVNGHRLIALPDIDKMLGDTRHVPAIVAYLRTAITLRG